MARYKMVGNNRIELTAEELTELNARETAWSNGALNRALNNLRDKRKPLLEETDWMANSDVTMSDDWKTYRQTLRDITNGLDTVEKVEAKEFPEKPE